MEGYSGISGQKQTFYLQNADGTVSGPYVGAPPAGWLPVAAGAPQSESTVAATGSAHVMETPAPATVAKPSQGINKLRKSPAQMDVGGQSEELEHSFLDAAKRFDWAKVRHMLQESPHLVNVQPRGRWSALHQASKRGALEEVQHLLQCKADPRLVTSAGQNALQLAGSADVARVLEAALAEASSSRRRRCREDAMEELTEAPKSFDSRFADCVGKNALIGLRDLREAVTEATAGRVSTALLRHQMQLQSPLNSAQVEGALRAMQNGLLERIGHRALHLYSLETWVYAAINKVMREHDKTATGLAPLARLMHDTLSDPPPDLPRFTGRCWRWLHLPQAVLDTYELKAMPISNIIAFAGFTSACSSAEKTWGNFQNLPMDANTLFCIDQDEGQGPVDISSVAEYPHEAEVIYALGQQFEILAKRTVRFEDLKAELGELGCDPSQFPKIRDALNRDQRITLVYLKAVDALELLITNIFRDGGLPEEAVEVLQARRELMRWKGTLETPAGAKLVLDLGYVKAQQGDLPGALAAFDDSKRIMRLIGTLESPGGADLLMFVGNVKMQQGDLRGALATYDDSKRIKRLTGTFETRDGAALLVNVAIVKEQLGDLPGALAGYEEGKRIMHLTGTLETPDGAILLVNVGNVKVQQGDLCGALAAYDDSKRIMRLTDTFETPGGAQLLIGVGSVKERQGDLRGALAAYDDSKRIMHLTGTFETDDGAKLLVNVGVLKERQGDLPGALAAYDDGKRIMRLTGTLETTFGAALLGNVGCAKLQQGDLPGALAAFDDSKRIMHLVGTLETPGGAELLTRIGFLKKKQGDLRGAQTVFQESHRIHTKTGTLGTPKGCWLLEEMRQL